MLEAKDVAYYFIAKDTEKKLFTSNLVNYNNRNFYEGNARINKYLFLAQVVHLAKFGKKLFNDDFLVYDNGPIINEIMRNYLTMILNIEKAEINKIDKSDFLDKIYFSLENASIIELIEITHEDPEWLNLRYNACNSPKMNLENHIDEYKRRYKGLIEALNL